MENAMSKIKFPKKWEVVPPKVHDDTITIEAWVEGNFYTCSVERRGDLDASDPWNVMAYRVATAIAYDMNKRTE